MVVGPRRGRACTAAPPCSNGPEQITDAEPDDCPVAPAGRWIVDPDGAVVRAGLVRHYAARHGLWQLDPDIAYLSGDRLPDGVRGFEVLDELGFSEKRLRQALCGARRGRRRDPGARRRRRPRRAAAAAEAARVRRGVGGDHPHRLRHGKSGNGIHLPTLALNGRFAAACICGVGGDRAALGSKRISSMRIPTSVLAATAAVLLGFSSVVAAVPASAAPPKCSDLKGGLVGQNCVIQEADAGYNLQHHLPGRLSRRAGRLRLGQADQGRIRQRGEVARRAHHALPARGHPDRVQLGGPAPRHAVGGVQGLPGRRRDQAADLLQGVQLGSDPSLAHRARHRRSGEDAAAVPAGRQPVADHLPAGGSGPGEAAGHQAGDRTRRSG